MSCIETWTYISGRQDQISSTTDVNVTSFLFNLNKRKLGIVDISSSLEGWDTAVLNHLQLKEKPGDKGSICKGITGAVNPSSTGQSGQGNSLTGRNGFGNVNKHK